MKGLKVDLREKICLFVDNKSSIDLAKHPTFHGRNKHIETRYHYIRKQVSNEGLEVIHYSSDRKLANILMKLLKMERFKNVEEAYWCCYCELVFGLRRCVRIFFCL